MGAALDTEVLVVGAGPVGLMLAGELRLGGAEVLVVEQRDQPATESRASTLHARTMEIFDSRGLLDRLGTVAEAGGPAALGELWRREHAEWGVVIREARITAE